MATEYNASKEGYVQAYRIEGTETPGADTYYFEVTITGDVEGTDKHQKWGLPRNNVSDVLDLNPTGKRFAISYSNTHQAIIATVKDALHNSNRVLFEGNSLGLGMARAAPEFGVPGPPAREIPSHIPGGRPFPIEPDADSGGVVIPPRPNPDDLPGFELRQVTIYK